MSASVEFGKQVGALPSGRLKGEPMGDSCSPYMGMDVNGPTAALRSVAKLPHNKTFPLCRHDLEGNGGFRVRCTGTMAGLRRADCREPPKAGSAT